MNTPANKITGANAGGPHQLPIRTHWTARVAQFGRSPTIASIMKSRCACLLLLGIFVTLTRPSLAAQDEFVAAVQSLIRDYVVVDKKSVGIVVGLVDERGSRIISYGKSDNPATPELNGDTVFEIGSITKVF